MKLPKALSWRVLAVMGALSGIAALSQSCMQKKTDDGSSLLATDIDKVQHVIRTFRKVIGRDPGKSEINALKALPYDQLVDAILGSAQYDTEGYFNLHRERLLLNREGSQAWVKGSYDDYCALKLEFTERAEEDRTGAGDGYFNMLKYTDRWITIADFGINDCFYGTDIAALLEAKQNATPVTPPPPPTDPTDPPVNPTDPVVTPPDPNVPVVEPAVAPAGAGLNLADLTPKQKAAKKCVQRMKFGYPVTGEEDGQALEKEFWVKLKETPEADRAKSLMMIPLGEDVFLRAVKQNLFPEFQQLPEGETQPKDMKLELVKKDGKPMLLQELGTKGNQQCLFAGLDPINWKPKKAAPGGFNGGGDDDGNGFPTFPPPFLPNAIDVPPPVGVPDQPTIVAPQAAAANPEVAQALAEADGTVFMKFRFPKEYMGVHGSPYWLSRHTSKQKNQHLHRARAIYFSYYCTEINPDAANFVGAPITEFPDTLKPYFDPNDSHVKGSANCFNCHTKVQPLANFFGMTSFGTQYDQNASFELFQDKRWPQFLPENGGHNRPGAIYDGQTFFPATETKGLPGLAANLEKYPPVRQCIVDSAWASLVGRESPLFDEERNKAIAAFDNGGKPSLTKLMSHLLKENERGKTFMTKGEVEFAKIQPVTNFNCPDMLPAEMEKQALETMGKPGKKCKNCHEGEFFNDGKFDMNYYFGEGQVEEDSPEARGNLWHKLYCQTKLEKMPKGGGSLDQMTRGPIWCYFGRTRDRLADEGKIPPSYKNKACAGAMPAQSAMGAAPHTLGGTPPAGTPAAGTPAAAPGN